jgi:hypothetical protein
MGLLSQKDDLDMPAAENLPLMRRQDGVQNLGSRSLHTSERFSKRGLAARVKLNVIAARCTGVEPNSC